VTSLTEKELMISKEAGLDPSSRFTDVDVTKAHTSNSENGHEDMDVFRVEVGNAI
jgi:hypothetical protein